MKKLYAACAFCVLTLTACSFTSEKKPLEQGSTEQQAPEVPSDQATRGPKINDINTGTVSYLQPNQNFDEIIKAYDYVVADFYADWCGPCKSMSQVLEATAKNYGNIVFLKVNVDKFGSLFARFKQRGIPYLAFYRKGAKVDENPGSMSMDSLKVKLNRLITGL